MIAVCGIAAACHRFGKQRCWQAADPPECARAATDAPAVTVAAAGVAGIDASCHQCCWERLDQRLFWMKGHPLSAELLASGQRSLTPTNALQGGLPRGPHSSVKMVQATRWKQRENRASVPAALPTMLESSYRLLH